MKIRNLNAWVLALLIAPTMVWGQAFVDEGFGGANYAGAGGYGGYGGYQPTPVDPLETIRVQVGFADDEWRVVRARVARVVEIQQMLNTPPTIGSGLATMGGMGGYGGTYGGYTDPTAAAVPTDPVARAKAELDALLLDYRSTNAQIIVKTKALRAARAEAEKDLLAARKELLSVVTIRQEGLLVGLGLLD